MDDMGYQSMMYNNNYSYNGSWITGLTVLLVKLLFIVLIISIIIGIIMWIKNNFIKNSNITRYVNQNPLTKLIAGIIIAIISLFIILSVFGILTGNSMSFGFGMGNMYGYYGFGSTYGLVSVLILLFKLLAYFFVITLIISLAAYLIKQFGSSDFNLFGKNNSSTGNNSSQNDTQLPEQSNDASTSSPVEDQYNI